MGIFTPPSRTLGQRLFKTSVAFLFHYKSTNTLLFRYKNNHLDSLRNADLLLVTVKAPQVAQALTSIKQEIDADCIVVLMHNGMGTAEQISQLLPNNPLLLATTTHGALRSSSEQVLHTGLGSTQIGGYNQTGMQCQFVTEVFHHALAHVEWNSQILDALWNKLAINCAINPLTAIHQIYNGQLAEPHYAEAIHAIIGEVSQVMNAEGVEVTEQQLEARIYHVIEATAKKPFVNAARYFPPTTK
ncbi:2-dehydropantoate 2-reductase [Vibrio sinaloensis]|nr:2-dehydropantoate 2-reductase [Vibrio sinaloensis]